MADITLKYNNITINNSLQVGDVYEADGVVKIVRQTDIFSGSHQATSAIGSVTVTIT